MLPEKVPFKGSEDKCQKSLFPGSERLLSDAARNTKHAFVGQAGTAHNIVNIFAAQFF